MMGSLMMDSLSAENFRQNVYSHSRDPSPARGPVRRKSPVTMGDSSGSFDIPTPLQNIGCQDLLQYKCSHCGWLRKRRIHLNQILNWPQAYVVLNKGCLYYFRNEKSKSPTGKFSLYGYNSVYRASEIPRKEAPWSFKLVHSHEEFKTYFFSASSEQEMKVWMSCIKKEMVNANGKSAIYGLRLAKEKEEIAEKLDDSSFYQDIETNIYDGVYKFEISKDYQKQCSIKKKDEDSDDEDLIDKRPPLPLPTDRDPFCTYRKSGGVCEIAPPKPKRVPDIDPPPIPPHRPDVASLHTTDITEAKTVKLLAASLEKVITTTNSPRLKRRGSYEKTDVAVTPSSPLDHTVDFHHVPGSGSGGSTGEEDSVPDLEEYWASIHFDDKDKQRASDIIAGIADEGVYLVRPENTGKGKVLSVWAQGNVKKYRIHQSPEGEYYLAQNGFKDACLENLLCYYYEQELPTVSTRLKTPYKLHRKFKTLNI